MDPNTTWTMLCTTLRELSGHPEDRALRAQALELLDALAHWLHRGGFPPTSVVVDPAKEEV